MIVDCTTIVPGLSGSEFFGHERGAFTGAAGARDGAFALANRGTLFLDEIGDLPLPLQAELLRVVQERTFKRVGGNTWRQTDFRLVCATNRNLLEQVGRGEFRGDLYYRIANGSCRLPSLGERSSDILPLARHFLSKSVGDGAVSAELDPLVRDLLLSREYPGNVRDLRQLVLRICHRHVGAGPITIGAVPEEERPREDEPAPGWQSGGFLEGIRRAVQLGVPLKDISRAATDGAVEIAVDEEGGNLQRAAQRLQVTDRTLQMRRAAQRVNGAADGSDGSSRS